MTEPVRRPAAGVTARPADTLLVERARDFLAGGPADAESLVARVCQLPGVRGAMADRIVEELLGGRDEFARGADGRWTHVGAAAPHREVGRAPTLGVPVRYPSFEEWRAARDATRSAGGAPALDPAAYREREAGEPRVGRGRRGAVLPDVPLPGDDDALNRLSYVVVDVETTGGNPEHGHRITEIAAVIVRDGEVREVYETLVNPERYIPPQIVRLTGITAEMVRGERPFRLVADEVVTALQGHVFVAHNVTFDWRFVTHEVARATGQVLDGRRLCTVRLARKLLPQLRSRSLGFVADWYGADAFAATYFEARHGRSRPWRHSAAGDAVATAHCLLRMLEEARGHGVHTWGELDRWLSGGTGAAKRRRRSALPGAITKDTTA